MSDRLPPYSEEAEKGVLGALMLEGERVLGLAATVFGVTPEAWYVPQWRTIAEACWTAGKDGGRGIDILTVTDALRTAGTLESVGGIAGIEKVMDGTPTAAHAEYYLRILRDKWLLRKTITAAMEITQEAFGPVTDAELFCTKAPEKLMGLVTVQAQEADNGALMEQSIQQWDDARAYAQEHDFSKKPATGHPTPWEELTNVTCGLEQGLMLIAGRPSAGKTTLEDVLSRHVAGMGIRVGRISLDTSRKSLLSRMLAREARVSLPKLKFGWGRKDQIARLKESAEEIKKLPIVIRTDLADIAAIRMWALNEKRQHGLGLLTLDYVQQVQASELGWQSGNALAKTTYVIGKLKRLAQELEIPVIVLSQLSRSGEKEDRGDPQLSDLRDSGALEQDADKVLFVYVDKQKREDMVKREMEIYTEYVARCRTSGKNAKPFDNPTKHKRPVWIKLGKHKDGETGQVQMWMLPPYFDFTPAAVNWMDDESPADREEISHEYGVVPQFEPEEEG